MEKSNKTTTIISIVAAAILVVVIAAVAITELKDTGYVTNGEIKEIMKDFDKYFNSKERTVIYYASTDCGYCSLETPILETIAEDYDMDYLYVDSSKLPSKQRKEILDKLGIEHATPTTVIVENGKVIDTQVGYAEQEEYIEFFASNELLPEDAVYSKEANLTNIEYSEYENLVASNSTNVIVIGKTGCGYCAAIKPALNSIASEYGLTINYLNLSDMADDGFDKLTASLKEIGYDDPDFVNDGSFGTPLTLVVENGKCTKYIIGAKTKSQLVKEFTKAGLIK